MAGLRPRLFHRRIRLEPAEYKRPGAVCSITIGVQDRVPVFADSVLAAESVRILQEASEQTGVQVHAYCLMLDHVHLVVEPSPTCDIVKFISNFKGKVVRAWWSRGHSGTLWQRSFWDHFLRGDEDLERVVTYVLQNPVRAGLVDVADRYPYAGSLTFDL